MAIHESKPGAVVCATGHGQTVTHDGRTCRESTFLVEGPPTAVDAFDAAVVAEFGPTACYDGRGYDGTATRQELADALALAIQYVGKGCAEGAYAGCIVPGERALDTCQAVSNRGPRTRGNHGPRFAGFDATHGTLGGEPRIKGEKCT